MNAHLDRTIETRDGDDKSEARFTPPRVECPHPERWTSEDIEATENEVIEGVYGLVRMLQPAYVVETGTHRGFMAASIGRALQANGHGRLDTVEIEPALYADENRPDVRAPRLSWKPTLGWALLLGAAGFTAIVHIDRLSKFLYFQF